MSLSEQVENLVAHDRRTKMLNVLQFLQGFYELISKSWSWKNSPSYGTSQRQARGARGLRAVGLGGGHGDHDRNVTTTLALCKANTSV